MAERGKFIVFEGGEGTGKSTQAKLLGQFLDSKGKQTLLTFEPGDSPVGQKLRNLIMDKEANQDPRFALCLFLADRQYHLDQIVTPALAAGKVVICDRYVGSTLAYQSQAGGLDLKKVKGFNDFITGGLEPDLTILFDLDPQIGLNRKKNSDVEINHYDLQKLDFHQKLRRGFLHLAKILPHWEVVDANYPQDFVRQKVLALVDKYGIVKNTKL